MLRYFLAYKPFQVLSQFTSSPEQKNLSDVFQLPKNVYAVGRLDYDSEGLLLLTNDAAIKNLITHPSQKIYKEYTVQVEGDINEDAILQLSKGVTITVNQKAYNTQPALVKKMIAEPIFPARVPPIRFRKNIPTSWVSIAIHEGKNRQVRKMTAAVGFPTLRLIRTKIGNLALNNLIPGQYIELSPNQVYAKLGLQNLKKKT